jgi:formate dehydrogenase subunit beta
VRQGSRQKTGKNAPSLDAERRKAALREATVTLQKKVSELLCTKAVDLAIGYGRSPGGDMVPLFVRRPEEVQALEWNQQCVYNLVRYLTDPEAVDNPGAGSQFDGSPGAGKGAGKGSGDAAPGKPRVAIMVKGCDLKSLVVLQSENQVRRDLLTIIGLPCPGVADETGGLLAKCVDCPPDVYNPREELCDFLIGEPVQQSGDGPTAKSAARNADESDPGGQPAPYGDIEQIEALSPAERRALWDGYFARCLRCYACRNVCPLCYCKECVFDQHNPRWVSPAAAVASNRSFHLIRAYHLAGRCVDCGECERACPVGIPLRRINRKAAKVVEESFHFRAGLDPQGKSPLVAFADEDPQEFIE